MTTKSSLDGGHARATSAFPRDKERRKVRRLALLQPIGARLSHYFPVRVVDVSLHGARIEVDFRLLPRTPFELTILFPGGPFTAWTTVRRCDAADPLVTGRVSGQPCFLAGLEFFDLSAGAMSRLSYNLILLAARTPASMPAPRRAESLALDAERTLSSRGAARVGLPHARPGTRGYRSGGNGSGPA